MVKKYIKVAHEERTKWRIMLLGTFSSYILIIVTNFLFVVFFEDTRFVNFAPLFMIPTIGGMAYAILRHKVLNIKAITAEVLTFIILFISFVEILIAKDLKEIILRIFIFVLFFVFGVLLIKSVLREVRQRERLEVLSRELAAANERLKELDKLKTEFLSFASHQLRSPLTAIKGYASMLLENSYGALEEKAREPINRVMESANHLVKLIEDFLNVTKIEQGGMKYEIAKTDIEHLARELARELSVSAEKKGLKLTFETDGKVGYYANADQEKLRQVLLNFIDNAIKYTPSGTVKVVVGKTPDRKVRVSVSDSGVGMTAEAIGKLFAKFSRADEKKVNINGSGLGLYLAKQIVEAHGGRIWAESPGPDLGSTFSIELAIIV